MVFIAFIESNIPSGLLSFVSFPSFHVPLWYHSNIGQSPQESQNTTRTSCRLALVRGPDRGPWDLYAVRSSPGSKLAQPLTDLMSLAQTNQKQAASHPDDKTKKARTTQQAAMDDSEPHGRPASVAEAVDELGEHNGARELRVRAAQGGPFVVHGEWGELPVAAVGLAERPRGAAQLRRVPPRQKLRVEGRRRGVAVEGPPSCGLQGRRPVHPS